MSVDGELNSLLARARAFGVEVRYEHLGGAGGGACLYGGLPRLFVDLSVSSEENLELLKSTLARICATSEVRKLTH